MTEAKPPLDDDAVALYARQIIVPGVGAAGQARLSATTVAAIGNRWGCDAAISYLAAAGLRVATPPFGGDVDVVVLADHCAAAAHELGGSRPEIPVAWYALDEDSILGGLTTASQVSALAIQRSGSERDDTLARVAHRMGGLDAASTAIAAVLDWQRPPEQHRLGRAARKASSVD